jgi:hypothetical protein
MPLGEPICTSCLGRRMHLHGKGEWSDASAGLAVRPSVTQDTRTGHTKLSVFWA